MAGAVWGVSRGSDAGHWWASGAHGSLLEVHLLVSNALVPSNAKSYLLVACLLLVTRCPL